MKNIYLESLGCRLNAAEIETLARRFVGAGYLVVDAPEQADVIVINTCAVTAQAARKSRHRLRTLHRRRPEARVAVVGCWVTEELDRARRLPGVAWALGNEEKARAVELITGADAEPTPWSPGAWGHTRAFLAVQDGCDHACTYCITRHLRGPSHSRPLDEVVQEVRSLVARGAQEVVLTGVSLGAYGRDLGVAGGLATLVAALLADTDVPRLRLSSIEPWDVGAALLRQWENPRLCRQLHLPLQSGADAVLRRMGRRITAAAFAGLVARARAVAPAIAITTDVIVGFPGETAEDFAASLAFVQRMAFARLHVFPYSERAGTPAVRLPNPVPEPRRAERAARMRALGRRLAAAYRQAFVGQTLPVLWQGRGNDGLWRGLTDNYLYVRASSPASLYNRVTPTRLVGLRGSALLGEVALD